MEGRSGTTSMFPSCRIESQNSRETALQHVRMEATCFRGDLSQDKNDRPTGLRYGCIRSCLRLTEVLAFTCHVRVTHVRPVTRVSCTRARKKNQPKYASELRIINHWPIRPAHRLNAHPSSKLHHMLLPHTYIHLHDAQGYECSDRIGQIKVLPATMNEGVARKLETSLLLTFVLISLLCCGPTPPSLRLR